MQVSHGFAAGSAVFDDDHLVSCAGLVPVMTLAEQTGLGRLFDQKVTSGRRGSGRGRSFRRRSWPPWWRGCVRARTVSMTSTWSERGYEDTVWRGVCALDGTWSVSRRFRTFLQLHGQPRRFGLVRQLGTYQDGGVIKTAALLPADLNRLTRETDMLLATVDSLTDEEFAAPSKCEGWTRADVVRPGSGAHAMGK